MAARHSSRSRGFHVEEMPWGWYARGRREALIQHGITLEGPFPGDSGEKKTTCKAIDPLGREISIRRNSKTTFSVFRDWSEEEKALQERRQKREKELQAAKKLVGSWPNSTRDFRERTGRSVAHWLDTIERLFDDGISGGYRFDDAACARIYELSDQLRGMVEAGGVVMDTELRKKHTPACISEEVISADSDDAAKHDNSSVRYGVNVVPFRKPPAPMPQTAMRGNDQ